MPDENNTPPINDELEAALKEFEDAGGFSGKSKAPSAKPKPKPSPSQAGMPAPPAGAVKPSPGLASKPNPPAGTVGKPAQAVQPQPVQKDNTRNGDIDDDFDDFLSDIDDSHEAFQGGDGYHEDDNEIEEDYQAGDVSDEIEDIDHFPDEDGNDGDTGSGGENAGGKGEGDRIELLKKKLKEPKNAIILVVAICFILFLILQGGGKKKKIQYQNAGNIQEEVLSDVADVKKGESVTVDAQVPVNAIPNVPLGSIQLPNLDINLPDINKSNIALTPQIPPIPEPKIPEPKIPEPKPADVPLESTEKKPLEIPAPEEIVIKKTDNKRDDDIPLPDADDVMPKKVRGPITDKNELKPLVTDFTGGATIPSTSSKKKVGHDFIFIDTDLDTEIEQNAISATRIQNPENVVAQGRMIDAVLETAINSTIGGQVRAIVSRDVYAEVGRNILIPKGTRLYGEYGSGGKPSEGGRVIITWTRIMRPDNVSAAVKSFASDQFGRSGIQGEVNSKGFGSITSSILLSAIPLVTTIVTNALTNQNAQTTTVGAATGATTIVQDPINIATQSFTQQVAQMTSDIVKNIVDTNPTITLDQGTRIKVLVNQDIKLPTYKPVTKSSTGASGG